MILADELAVIFYDRYARVVGLLPLIASIDIVDDNLESATNEGQQLFDELLAKVAALPAVHVNRF